MLEAQLENILKVKPYLQNLIFRRGYLLTSQNMDVGMGYPFYRNWTKTKVKNYYLYVHKDQKHYIQYSNNDVYILVGHAYNPWNNVSDENIILETLVKCMDISKDRFFEELSRVTGVFAIFMINEDRIVAVQDSVGIMPVFYMDNLVSSKEIFFSSHSQLIADLCNLKMDANIEKLINSKFYLIGIRHLPGIKSPFEEVKTLTANTYFESDTQRIIRFYPNATYDRLDEQEALETICTILKNSMMLISDKHNSSISLTGGIDSKMTLAATNGIYEKYKYFSFFSSEAEKKDAISANNICKVMGLEHKIYEVPGKNEDIKDFDLIYKIIDHNSGYVKKHKDAEIRKIAYLLSQNDIEFEVKSHVSEIGRGFYYKKHGLKTMPKHLRPRHMSNFYKRNMFDRKTLKYMDHSFIEFIKTTDFGKNFSARYDESDMFYWEHRMSQWAAFVKQDFDISHETTIIYNNRKLLDIFMNFSIENRIKDLPQREIIKRLNQELYELNINNENPMKNKKRILLERLFFEINSIALNGRDEL
ncbi:MAG: hypothetical protein GX947_07930 [Tissierellia bacterium]|nr:hypothetical protein [Tissierellia bacterium]